MDTIRTDILAIHRTLFDRPLCFSRLVLMFCYLSTLAGGIALITGSGSESDEHYQTIKKMQKSCQSGSVPYPGIWADEVRVMDFTDWFG